MIELDAVVNAGAVPIDAVLLAQQAAHLVVLSLSAQRVFRVGLSAGPELVESPCDVGHSHLLAVAMANAGLNVLAPSASMPQHIGDYIVSASPIAEPLAQTGWRSGEPRRLGAAMAHWSAFTSPLLSALDIPSYADARIRRALASTEPELRAAAHWCRRQQARVESRGPWKTMSSPSGCIHGDPNLGNLVRERGREEPVFIDLDSVRSGPRFFDLAVMTMYRARFERSYPATEIIAGYTSVHGPVPNWALYGLRDWKELSSYTQLLTRWDTPGIAEEFWRRVDLDDDAPWLNVTQTLVRARA